MSATLEELKQIARDNNLTGWSSMNKDELLAFLRAELADELDAMIPDTGMPTTDGAVYRFINGYRVQFGGKHPLEGK